MNEQNRTSYYAIIPSTVRYCKELKFAERLLYGEITALAGKEGYCYASNRYFADLYNVIPGTISRYVSHLEQLGFIKTEIIKNNNNQITERRIYIIDNTYEQNKQYPKQNGLYPISKKAIDNNINIRIDRFFNYIINNNEEKNPENMTINQMKEFSIVLERLELNYTKEILKVFEKDNIEKIKIMVYSLKEIFIKRNTLIARVTREKLIAVYDNCKSREIEYRETDKEIRNFFEYYYVSLIKKLEKAI